MSSIGTNTHSIAAGGCGMPPALPRPAGTTTAGGGFSLPTPPTGSGIAAERFAHSAAGGVIIGKDGAPAGRIPAGSFVDVKAGTVYGADGKAITIPEGATVDFFDLPDLEAMRNAPSAAAPLFGGGASAPGKTQVDGQWGPGGITPIKGGGTPPADCGMDHGPTKAGGSTSTSTSSGTTVAAGGTTATTAPTTASVTAELNKLIETLQKQVATLTGTTAATTTAGGSTAVAGANSLGSSSSLSSALTDLVAAIRELGEAIKQSPVLGGGPGQKPPGKDLPPTKPPTTPPTTQLPPSTPPTTQVPPTTTTPPSTSSSGSTSGSSDTTAPASGSSSS